MKFEISQKELLKHISIAQKAISSRTTIQILEGILFTTKDNCLILTSTDLELSIETKVNCLVEEEGQIVINSSMIGNIVRKLPDAPIKVNVVGDNIQIKCMNSEFNLIGQDYSDYPPLPKRDGDKNIKLETNILKNAIKQTVFASSQDETRPALTGVLVELANNELNFVALDGFRISLRKFNIECKEDVKEIIPSRALVELQKILEDDQSIEIDFISNNIVFDLDDTLVYSRLLDGKFINYKDIISDEYSTKVEVNKKDFQDSLERASLLAREEKANLIKISVKNNNLNITSNSEYGNVNENIACMKEGEDIDIAFNAKYLLDGLKVIDSENCEILLTGSLNPCIIHPVDEDIDYTYLVLPVRLGRE
ncbi:DNA polymerase III subunit beta [Miniphocaeibacter massiliensis]|uniref:DNA polymerase III subunit beta n=1 Tax=Miniphocaeibacter massiliensis TaxID=2041841 RepID=UPI000C1C28C5|nr:DNA polymerase III subunit beta [Miniphocaeibacter massiliensis]